MDYMSDPGYIPPNPQDTLELKKLIRNPKLLTNNNTTIINTTTHSITLANQSSPYVTVVSPSLQIRSNQRTLRKPSK
jgi:hypothetical protein